MNVNIACVGIHSLFSEPDRNGTPNERHVMLADLDSKRGITEPAAFRAAVLQSMRAHGLPDIYVMETAKGLHQFSPWLQSRRHAERFEEAMHEWGSDGAHRSIGYWNGGTVLRVTPKPGEGVGCDGGGLPNPWHSVWNGHTIAEPDCPVCFGTGWTGPRLLTHLHAPEAVAPWSFWSGPHMDFMAARYGLNPPSAEERRIDRTDGLRFEHYETPPHKVIAHETLQTQEAGQ